MKTPIVRLLGISTCFLLAGFSSGALALKPTDITQAELAMLPRYCMDAQSFGYGDAFSNTSPNAGKWVAMMGKSFWHIHHHCWALINVRRAEQARLPKETKIALLGDALGDFGYVVKNTPDDFILLPEIFTWIGRVQTRLGQYPQASDAFAKARSLKPDYWPSYYHHGELLKMHGKKTEALEIVKAGLQQGPDAKPLQLLYHDLGGKLGDIPPPVKPDQQ